MGFFDFIFGKTMTVDDIVFGTMTYEKFKDSSKNYFIAYTNLANNPNKISVYVDADENGPTDSQQKFYRSFLKNYQSFIPNIKAGLDIELQNFQNFDRTSNFEQELVLESLHIPRSVEETNKWKISYYSKLFPEWSFLLEMKNDTVISVLTDS